MTREFNLNKLLSWARNEGISLEIHYSETSDELSVETHSASNVECFYMKRVPNIDYFIEAYIENFNQKLKELK